MADARGRRVLHDRLVGLMGLARFEPYLIERRQYEPMEMRWPSSPFWRRSHQPASASAMAEER